MSYTPPFSTRTTVSIRRLAWALQMPMTRTMEHVVAMIPNMVDPEVVCAKCRDRQRCKDCIFHERKQMKNFEELYGL